MLIVERFDNGMFDAPQRERMIAVARQSAIALDNAQSHRERAVHAAVASDGASRMVCSSSAVAQDGCRAGRRRWLIAAALVLIPADFDVTAHGQLQPERRREVFARSDGIVIGDELKVEHGDVVQDGALLGMLRKPQLDFESSRIEGELQTAQEKLNGLRNSRLAGGTRKRQRDEKVDQLAARGRRGQSPIDEPATSARHPDRATGRSWNCAARSAGTVLTWNVQELLAARPVTRGQVLLTVADLSGPWVLEIRMPDDRIGHVLAAEDEQKSAHRCAAECVVHRGDGAGHDAFRPGQTNRTGHGDRQDDRRDRAGHGQNSTARRSRPMNCGPGRRSSPKSIAAGARSATSGCTNYGKRSSRKCCFNIDRTNRVQPRGPSMRRFTAVCIPNSPLDHCLCFIARHCRCASTGGPLHVDSVVVTLIDHADLAAREAGPLEQIAVHEGQTVETGAAVGSARRHRRRAGSEQGQARTRDRRQASRR